MKFLYPAVSAKQNPENIKLTFQISNAAMQKETP